MKNAYTQAHLYHPSIKYTYPCRGVLHTPHKYSARNKRIDLKSENVRLFPLETIVGCMKNAYTQAHPYIKSLIVRNNWRFLVQARTVVSDNTKYLVKVFINVLDNDKQMRSYLLLIETMINDCTIYLLSIETIFNPWNRYLLLSETTENLWHRCASLSETIGGLGYMCDRVGEYCIRPSIIPNKNGQSFGDSLFIHSSLAGYLQGVCNTPLHGYAYLIDRWQGRFYVGAYCIRPSIIPNENGKSFGDSLFIHSSLARCLQGVCNTPIPRYAHLIDGW